MTPEESNDIKRHFDVVAVGLRSDIRMVADGVSMNTQKIDHLDGEFREFKSEMYGFRDEMYGFRDEMHAFKDETCRNFIELRSMIKLSYAELDRRLTTLEAGYGDLAARLERVEIKLAS